MSIYDEKPKGIKVLGRPRLGKDVKVSINITISPSVLKELDARFGGSRSGFIESAILNELNKESFQ